MEVRVVERIEVDPDREALLELEHDEVAIEVEGRAVLRGPLEASGFVAYAYGEQAATGQPMRRVPPISACASRT